MKKILLLLAIVVLTGACEKDDPPPKFDADKPADAGNLLIINNANRRLVLYKDEVPMKKIPSSSSDFLVNLQNSDGQAVELALYEWEDVEGDINNPPLDMVFKKWKVSLANSTAVSDQVTWHVSDKSEHSTMATIYFNYYAGSTDYHADVFLNGRNGAKLMSLAPGQQYRKIGLDYGTHTLAYHYWHSDQNTADASEDIGWIEEQTINGDEGEIWLVLNENREEVTMVVPHFGNDLTDHVKYGNLKVVNDKTHPVQVYVGQQLIESVCYLEDGNVKNLSTIAGQEAYTFVMPITDEETDTVEYNLRAMHPTTGNAVKEEKVTVHAEETLTWTIEE
ncbi:MAG: hypothetical protein ACQEQ0_02580 [Bacteroidota bacterium]